MEYILLGLIAAQTTYLSVVNLTKNKRQYKNLVFIDTSVLIDGRIKALVETGFFPGVVAIPRSVVRELQTLADNGDSEKRSRARHGLDIVNELQAIPGAEVVIFSDDIRTRDGVDNRLLDLAKKYNSAICTIDYNLNKVAQVEDVKVLNVNDIAKTLRMEYLPGERVMLEISQKGNDNTQGVGHLSDGTMVVVEGAKQHMGKVMEVEFTRAIQTSAGKMMFAKLVGKQGSSVKPMARKSDTAKVSDKTVRAPKTENPTQRKKVATREKSSGRKRVTPEDRLVELANK